MMTPRVQRMFTARPVQQRGAVIVMIVIALLAILMMAALVLDGGHMLLNKTRLQNAVDAAALSGAKTLSQVMGAGNAATTARDAALFTLNENAKAAGNKELLTAIGGKLGAFAVVELADNVYGPFSFPGPANATYVRVSVPKYALGGFFWSFAQSFGTGALGAKQVAAIATAGPSPTSPCDLAPLLVCPKSAQYDPDAGIFWGYRFGDLEVLKSASKNSDPIGPGNFQLLDFGSGGKEVGELMAGGGSVCRNVGENVTTKPGNTVGPSVKGLNTRFGEYSGSLKSSDYPPDLVTTYSNPVMKYNDKTARLEQQGQLVTSSNGNLSAGGTPLFDYNDYAAQTAACVAGGGSGCQSNGVFERRMLKIVVGDCSGKNSGASSIPVIGFGCFFVVQPADNSGGDSQIFGQFVKQCEGDGVPGPTPQDDSGPQIIQLYKTFISGSGTPSTDS
ncbi:TadE/TadG family type IV pilus assembly protein [Pseudomonas sp. S1(2024)]|uniref:TadE/TadG family type IV pilus assembly protein n=1 Tax=Pseudomonas sp. S1(2024) TaxID=3390191 RepID=UPI003979F56F